MRLFLALFGLSLGGKKVRTKGIARGRLVATEVFMRNLANARENSQKWTEMDRVALVGWYVCAMRMSLTIHQFDELCKLVGVDLSKHVRVYEEGVALGALKVNGLAKVDHKEWTEFWAGVKKSTSNLYTELTVQPRILQITCPTHGLYSLPSDGKIKLYYTVNTAEPKLEAYCPKCNKMIITRVPLFTADVLELSGVETEFPEGDLDESSIEEFIADIDHQMELLLG